MELIISLFVFALLLMGVIALLMAAWPYIVGLIAIGLVIKIVGWLLSRAAR